MPQARRKGIRLRRSGFAAWREVGELVFMITRALAPWLLFLALFLLPAITAIGVARAEVPADAIAPFAAHELAPGVHLLAQPEGWSGPATGNVTVIEQSDGIVLVDSGASVADGRRVVAFVRSLTDKPVKAVLITHWHNDHPLGVSAIREAWPRVRIIATERTRDGLLGPARTSVALRPDAHFETQILNEGSLAIAQVQALLADPSTAEDRRGRIRRYIENLRNFARDWRGTYLVPPTETFTDSLTIDDPVRSVRIMFLGRANTEGDAVAWLPRERIVVTGDIVVSPVPFGFFSFPEPWIATLERIKALDFALLVPGHGQPMRDSAYLDRLIATISDIRAQVGPLARQGLSLEDVRSRVDFTAQTAIFAADARLRPAFEGYWLTPMVENAWREARGLAIVQGGGDTTAASVNSRRSR